MNVAQRVVSYHSASASLARAAIAMLALTRPTITDAARRG